MWASSTEHITVCLFSSFYQSHKNIIYNSWLYSQYKLDRQTVSTIGFHVPEQVVTWTWSWSCLKRCEHESACVLCWKCACMIWMSMAMAKVTSPLCGGSSSKSYYLPPPQMFLWSLLALIACRSGCRVQVAHGSTESTKTPLIIW